MLKTKILLYLANGLLLLCLPLFLLSAGINLAVNAPLLYSYGFEKYQVSEVTGISVSELKEAASQLREYFSSNEEYPDISVEKDGESAELFNEKEKIHLKDVKELFNLNRVVMIASFAFVVLYWLSVLILKRQSVTGSFGRGMFYASGFTLAVLAAFVVLAVTDFGGFFYKFHQLAFTNDFWQLDPSTDYLIMMFPQGFWSDSAMLVAAFVGIGAVMIGAVSLTAVKADKG